MYIKKTVECAKHRVDDEARPYVDVFMFGRGNLYTHQHSRYTSTRTARLTVARNTDLPGTTETGIK